MKPFLLEIGMEEIPARFIPQGIESLKNGLMSLLDDASIDFGEIREFATPRRMAILIEYVSEKQKDRKKEVIGPPKKIAVDEKGDFTKAAEGFAKSQNTDIRSLRVVKTERGEYIAANIEEKGRETKDVLSDLLPKFIASLQFPKSMRWGSGTLRFARPIQWITALFGPDVIPFELDGLKSSNLTNGHRFMSQGALQIKDPFAYPSLLLNNFVIADANERKKIILEEIKKIESTANCKVHEDNELMDTVTFLVEYPTVILGNFDAKYLSLPAELLITVMKSHQKYFSVEDKDGNLLPHFILISNTKAENNDIVKKGAERVLRARLEDAGFYCNEDQKKPLWDYIEKLKEVTFQEKLGSLYEKVKRIAFLCSFFADTLNFQNKEKLLRASMLSKADLVTGIVREFPELQGYMGMVYAKNSGEDKEVASAIYEHYMPRFSGDSLPSSENSAIISLADKIDNIASFFLLGLIPTGSEDPFALKRQAMGIINILQNKDYPFSIDTMIDKALEGIESHALTRNQLKAKILKFFEQRFEGILSEEGYRYDLINAVLTLGNQTIRDIKNRIKIFTAMTETHAFPELLTAAKRVYNILSNIKTGEVKKDILTEPSEKELYDAVLGAGKRLIKTNFNVLFELTDPINLFFNNVLVMDKNPEVKANRLALLSSVKKLFDSLGDFSKVVNTAESKS
ncbi:MAG: glycine--tRNA ligase subunit beta [Nitrospirota bacterium]